MADRGQTVVASPEQSSGIVLDVRRLATALAQGSQTFIRNAFGYWLSALQDLAIRVQWVSFTPDLVDAPVGHAYTELQIEARWLL